MSPQAQREIGAAESARDGEPQLSVLLASDKIRTAAETISHLRAQTAADQIELVLGLPGGMFEDDGAEQLNGFHSTRVIEVDPELGAPAARAAAAVAARAPVVVMAETHCFPQPGWAEALIAAHRESWAAVGPEFDNDNPDSATSWANLLVDYAPWVAPATPGRSDDIPGHNSSYKRSVLLEYGSELPRMLEAESILHWDLRAKGHEICMEPRARVRHRNITRRRAAFVEHFLSGRLFGGSRAQRWHPARRVLHAIAAPLVPPVRLARTLRLLRQKKRRDIPRAVIPMTLVMFTAHAIGEVVGYFLGAGRSAHEMGKYEINKNLYVRNLPPSLRSGEPLGKP